MSSRPLPTGRQRARRFLAAPLTWLLLAGLGACAEQAGDAHEAHPAATPPPSAGSDAPTPEEPAGTTPVAEAAASDEDAVAVPDSPAGAAAPLPDLTGWMQTEGHLGLHTLAWRPLDHERVPRNQEFSAEVVLLRDDALAPGARVQVTGYMPAHAHGLVQMPVCEEVGEGRYRVDGLLLHMRGHWQVRFTIVADRQVETATFELDL